MLDLSGLDLEAIGNAFSQQDTCDLCWLLDRGLVDETATQESAADHPDPPLP
jgi:hypothetical protein